jgi:hypothetical protein
VFVLTESDALILILSAGQQSSDCGQICLKVSEPQMRRQLEAMLNRPVRKRITFARQFNLSTTAANDWYHLVRLLAHEVGQTGGFSATGSPWRTCSFC